MNCLEKNNKPFQGNLQWNDYSTFIKNKFGVRIQKISVNAGFTCPNRDGSIGKDGCIYCINKSFSPFYCSPELSIEEQLIKGIDFFYKKYKSQRYLAYFQTFTNTYQNIDTLKKIYTETLAINQIEGLIISTRPDCINEEILNMLKEISKNKYLSIEYGTETTKDETLEFINRGHTWQQTVNAVELTKKFQINCGLHLILGLPKETETDFITHAKKISKLPVNFLKIHQLQVLKDTKLYEIFKSNPQFFIDLSLEKYKKYIINFIENINPEIIIDRLTSESPKGMLIYPNWDGKKNFEISHIINNEMKKNNTWQGKYYGNSKKLCNFVINA